MNDFVQLGTGFIVCVVPPALFVAGALAFVKYLRRSADADMIEWLGDAVSELRRQNLILLNRVKALEHRLDSGESVARVEEADAQVESEDAGAAGARAHAVQPGPHAAPEAPGDEPAGVADAVPANPLPDGVQDLQPEVNLAARDAASGDLSDRRMEAQVAGDAATAARTVDPAPPAHSSEAPSAPPVQAAQDEGQGIRWEQWIGVKGAAALGASILVVAGIYFFEYSIEHGLITPAMRMVAGTLVGLGCVAVSELRLRRSHEVLASWLVGAGIAILYTAFWAGKALYELYPSWAAGLLMVAVTGTCLVLSTRHRSAVIALLGLCGGFVTPLALSTGSDRPISLFGYILLLDAAMLWLAYRRRWPWLAALCLLGTGIYQQSWLFARLDEPRLILGVVIVGVFALVFALLPRLPSDADDGSESPEESLFWRITRSAGVLLPLMFTLPLAMRQDLGDTFFVTAAQLVLLCIAACYLGLRRDAVFLPASAALVSAATLFTHMLAHTPETPARVWGPVGLAVVLLAVFAGFAELPRLLPQLLSRPLPEAPPGGGAPVPPTHLAAAGALYALALLVMTGMAAPLASVAGPWPWLLLWALVGLATARLSTLLARPELQVLAAGVVSLGLGVTYAIVAGTPGQPPSALYLGAILGAAVITQLGGLLPARGPDARRFADHAAALFALIAIPLVAAARHGESLPSWALYATTLALAVLALLAAARRGSALWLAAAAVVTAGAHSLWVMRYPDGPFSALDLASLGAGAVLFSVSPAIAPKRLRERAWAWRTPAIASALYFLALRHVWVELLGTATIGALPIALAVLAIGAAYAARVRGPERAGARKSALAWLSAAGAGFVTLAIPLQLSNEWITIGLALEAVALTLLWRRLDHAGLKYFALALVVAVSVRLLANPWVLDYHPRSGLRIINWLAYTYLVPAACFVGMWFTLREKEAERLRTWERRFLPPTLSLIANLSATSAIFVVFAWINLAIFDWFAPGSDVAIDLHRLPARDLSLSIAWGVYAVGLLALGMWRKSTALRIVSGLLILLTCAKVFLYDLGHLSDLYRVASLVGLALALIAISLAYSRFVFRADKPKPEASPVKEDPSQ